MPFYYRRRWPYWRRRRPRTWRFRKTFRRRPYRRRHWVRRFYYRKRKAKKLKITEWQPKSIRKCKIKGFLCLFQTTEDRLSYNFDMYEESWVPEKLPGGGGFSIKNLSLQSLYEDHVMGHNIFTKTNNNYPLARYLGCSLKFYQSSNIDYVATYSNVLPLRSSMAMYNTMQPSIHLMQQHKIIVPSKLTQRRHRPYIKKFIPPPSQMKSQWYFQHDISKTPLFMLRTTALTLDNYYIGSRQLSTNITIYSLNTSIIQNRNWGKRQTTWWCRTLGTQHYFLWGTRNAQTTNINNEKLINLIPLTNTQDFQPGYTFEEYHRQQTSATYDSYLKQPENIGNPFDKEWIDPDQALILMPFSPTQMSQYYTTVGSYDNFKNKTLNDISTKEYSYTTTIKKIRYNPYKDKGTHNNCFFLPVGREGHGWDPTGDPDLRNNDLPLWLLLFGYSDFVKKTGELQQIDTNYILTINTQYTNPTLQYIVPLSESFIHGRSPYTPPEQETPDVEDTNRWNPTYQYQQEMINNICLSGPGTPKIPKGITTEAKVKYCFYFKWGGDLPPMSTITDPYTQPTYPIPHNNTKTTSLQNPAIRPETFLYSFDERRGQLTEKATQRMQKDWETKEIPFLSTEHRFAEPTTQIQQETSSSDEEEEENLFKLLDRQRTKQLHLKQRIITTLKKLQNL
nr:MAG: ORF1 [TTV-like mini virus]